MNEEKNSRCSVLRCLNCFSRFSPGLNAERATCPECNIEWRITWLNPTFPKIRGPVWDGLDTTESRESIRIQGEK